MAEDLILELKGITKIFKSACNRNEFDCGSSLEARSCLVIGHLNRNQVICRGKDRDGHSALSIFESALAACERRGILLTFTADLKRVVLIIDRIDPVRFSCKDHIIPPSEKHRYK